MLAVCAEYCLNVSEEESTIAEITCFDRVHFAYKSYNIAMASTRPLDKTEILKMTNFVLENKKKITIKVDRTQTRDH